MRRLTNQAKFMHSDLGRYWYSVSASLNRIAADRAGQLEEALVLMEINKALVSYINGIGDRGHFDAVQVAPAARPTCRTSRAASAQSWLAVDAWHDVVGEPTFADAILDRLVHNAYRFRPRRALDA